GTAIAAGIAFIRALPTSTGKIGNFYADLTRVVLTILLPVSIVVAILLNSQGVPQTLNGLLTTGSFEGASQTIPIGPVASWESIKMFGTNGGGYFGANSAHPFENPNGWTNFLTCLGIILIPVATLVMFGKMLNNYRHAAVIVGVMLVLSAATLIWAVYWDTTQPNPALTARADQVYAQDVPQQGGKVKPVWVVAHAGCQADVLDRDPGKNGADKPKASDLPGLP